MKNLVKLFISPLLIFVFLISCSVEENTDPQDEISQNIDTVSDAQNDNSENSESESDSDSNQDSSTSSNNNLNLSPLIENLNFDAISNIINSKCTSVFFHNNYRFFIESQQCCIADNVVIFRTTNYDLNSWIDQKSNYLALYFRNDNKLDLIQVYKDSSLTESIDVQENETEQLDALTSFFDGDNFFSQTTFNNQNIDTIEDGVYLSTTFVKNIELNENIDRFNCLGYGKEWSLNHLSQKGKEYFKIVDGEVTGRVMVYDADLDKNFAVWSLEDWYYSDVFTNKSRSITNIKKNQIDDYTKKFLNISNSILLYENDEIDGYKKETILTKVSLSEIGLNMIDSYEGFGFYADEVYSEIDFNDPLSYLKAFIKDAARNNIDLSYINLDNFQFNIVPDNEWTGDATAVALRGCNDDEIEISYKESLWISNKVPYRSSIPESVKVMWHEFGHDILNLEHVCLGDHIMSGRHQDPQIVYSSDDCNEPYIAIGRMDWGNLDLRKNFQRAVLDMFSGHEQIYYSCSNNN